jgi:DNA-binding transcriptional LysR family regulator
MGIAAWLPHIQRKPARHSAFSAVAASVRDAIFCEGGVTLAAWQQPRWVMNLKEVEAFRAIMLSGSMTAAANDLYTSQPNVSRLLARLEKSLGLKLFNRAGGRLVPTDEGQAFYREVERSFIGLKSLEAAAKNIREFGTGRLRVAAAPSYSLGFVPRVLRQFFALAPSATVFLHTSTSTLIEQWTASHFCDIGLTSLVSEDTSLVVERLGDMKAVCVLPPGHRLAAKARILLADLEGESFVSTSHGDGKRERIDKLFEDAKVTRKLHIETQYGAAMCNLVGQGLGVSLVSPLVARDYQHTGIVVRPFESDLTFPTFLLSSAHRPRSVLANEFAALLKRLFAAEIQEYDAI